VEETALYFVVFAGSALQWGHGDEAVEELHAGGHSRGRQHRFNGATAMKPWKSNVSRKNTRNGFKLQWGHGDEAVEEASLGNAYPALRRASMGPRR